MSDTMSFFEKVKAHKDLLGFATAVVLATIGVLTFFATKIEVESLQCQLSKFIQLNQDTIWLNKTQTDLQSVENNISVIEDEMEAGKTLTAIEAAFLQEQHRSHKQLLTQYEVFVGRVENLKKVTQDITMGGKCPE